MYLKGATHFNFSDAALSRPSALSKLLGALGPIDQKKALRSVSEYSREFLDTHVWQSQQQHTGNYPEVEALEL